MTARHVLTILAVDDVPRATAFYRAAFGWAQLVDVPVYAELAAPGGMRIGLYQRDGYARNTGRPASRTEPGMVTATELYLHVAELAELDAAIAAIRAAGGVELSPRARRDWGDDAAYFADLDANVIVVACRSSVSAPEVTTEVLQAFAEAWNRHDVDAIMSFMTEDCRFEASAGPEVCGTAYSGHAAVRAGFAEVWATFPDAHWGGARHVVCGDRGVSEWTFTGTRADGTRVEVHGCDLFTFRDGKIALKNSYRKNRPPLASPGR